MLDLRVSLGLRIQELRTSLQLSREQLGERAGIDSRQIANYELYGAWPDPETLVSLSRSLSIDIHDLFDFTETRRCPLVPFEERLVNRRRRSNRGIARQLRSYPERS